MSMSTATSNAMAKFVVTNSCVNVLLAHASTHVVVKAAETAYA